MAMLFSHAGAAGWGDLTVMSSLGQPLRAEIELISTSRQDDGPLTVKLASFDAYRQANIEFNPALMSLRFSVEQRGDRQFVRVTSTQSLNEPFVDMLLELSSGSGRMVREYVFLLDPAGIDGAQMAVVAPVGDASAQPSKAAPGTAQTATPAAAPAGAPQPGRQAARSPSPARQATAKAPAAKPAAVATAATKPRLTLSGVTAVSATDDKAGIIALEDYSAMEKQVAEANARVKALEQKVTELQKLLEVTNNLLAEMQKQNDLAKAGAKPPAPNETPAAAPAMPIVAEARPAEQAVPALASAPAVAPAAAPVTPPAPAKPKPAAPPPEEDADYLIPGAGLLVALLGAAGLYSARRRKAKKSFEPGLYDDAHRDKSTTSPNAGDTATTALATGVLLTAGHGHTHEVDPLAEADVYIAYGRDVQAEDILKEALNKQPDRHAVRVKLLSIYAGRKDLPSFAALAYELHGMTKGKGEDWEQAAELGREIDPANPLYTVQAAQAPVIESAPDTLEQALVLERVDDAPPAGPTLQPAAAAQDTPLPELTPTEEITPVALEASPDDVDFDLDGLGAEPEPLPAVPTLAEEVRANSPGPIDFDFLKPADAAPESITAVPELPTAALADMQADGNLLEFDFLKQDAAAQAGVAAVPEIPSALLEEAKPEASQEEALLEFDFLKAATAEQSEDGTRK